MKHHHLRLLLLSLAVGGSSSVFAQSNDLSYIFTARPKYTFSAALKIRTSGANVKFGNLGTIPASPTIQYQTDTTGKLLTDSNGAYIPNYNYQDGFVNTDAVRASETASTTSTKVGTVTTTTTNSVTRSADGKRYLPTTTVVVVDAPDPADPSKNTTTTTTTTTGDFLAYQTGQTRAWGYLAASQVVNGAIDMHNYSSNSEGVSREAESGASGGFDLQLARELGQIGKKGQWGFSFSLGVNDFNAKSSGRINAALITQTAHFSLLGQTAPTAPYSAPSATDFIPTINGVAQPPTQATETTVPLGVTPVTDTPVSTPGAAHINGIWKAKGAYYMMRLGPSFRYQFTKRVSLFGNAGFAAGYYGSVFSLTEALTIPEGVPNRLSSDNVTPQGGPSVAGEVRDRNVKLGYYGELNVEFWMTFRTGLFAGVVYERLGKFRQTLGGRTADVDIGGGAAVRIGIINRF